MCLKMTILLGEIMLSSPEATVLPTFCLDSKWIAQRPNSMSNGVVALVVKYLIPIWCTPENPVHGKITGLFFGS